MFNTYYWHIITSLCYDTVFEEGGVTSERIYVVPEPVDCVTFDPQRVRSKPSSGWPFRMPTKGDVLKTLDASQNGDGGASIETPNKDARVFKFLSIFKVT